jgi:hypothetical protein
MRGNRLALGIRDGPIEVLYKLWEWAKKGLKPEELNNMFLISNFRRI